jgi:hypothetical protein
MTTDTPGQRVRSSSTGEVTRPILELLAHRAHGSAYFVVARS